MNEKILITGAAGFIGYHMTVRLLKENYKIYCLDVINNYYDQSLKYGRLKSLGFNDDQINLGVCLQSTKYNNLYFIKQDLADYDAVIKLMETEKFDYVIHLAAQAGVRYSIENPRAYLHSNIDGFLSVLEGARLNKIKHFIYASTSSVYGLNSSMPLKENMPTDHPMALYAATKKANELMAHSFSHLFGLPTTALRFFTVYGPWGRPDMALFLFTKSILKGEPINIYNHGKMIRDFTYVGDIVESIARLLPKPPEQNFGWDSNNLTVDTSSVPYNIFNIGNGSPISIIAYIEALENALEKKAIYNFMEIQPGDVLETHADVSKLKNYINFVPNTSIEYGISEFVKWYNDYYY